MNCNLCDQPRTYGEFCSQACKSKASAKQRLLAGVNWFAPSECWLWDRDVYHNGYGRILVGGKSSLTHRLAFQLLKGPIPTGLFVCHRCDVRNCINPDHLFLGTPLDNMRDCHNKGRTSRLKGIERWNAVLNEEQVRLILQLHVPFKVGSKKIARTLGISNWQAIHGVLSGRRWKHVTNK